MPPGKVAPFISRQKTDANDAVGIFIACQQPNMTFCQVKSIEQLNIQFIESSRKFIKKTLISTSNHIIALFYEYGIAFGKDKKALKAAIARHLAPVSDTFPSPVKQTLSLLWQQYKDTATQLDNLEKQLATQVKETEPCTRLMELEGVGKAGAAALYAALGDGTGF